MQQSGGIGSNGGETSSSVRDVREGHGDLGARRSFAALWKKTTCLPRGCFAIAIGSDEGLGEFVSRVNATVPVGRLEATIVTGHNRSNQ